MYVHAPSCYREHIPSAPFHNSLASMSNSVTTALFDSHLPLAQQFDQVKEAIRSDPSKPSLRTFYFQLLAVLGDWTKALAQLQVCAQLDPKALPMAQAYREAMRCQTLRA